MDGELPQPIEVGQEYRDETAIATAKVLNIFVSEDGQTEIRLNVKKSHRDQNTLLVDAETVIERIQNGELTLQTEAAV